MPRHELGSFPHRMLGDVIEALIGATALPVKH